MLVKGRAHSVPPGGLLLLTLPAVWDNAVDVKPHVRRRPSRSRVTHRVLSQAAALSLGPGGAGR